MKTKTTTQIVAFSVILMLSISTFAVAGPVPDTGQTQSYTDTFGEDSDYTINPPSYTKLDAQGNDLPDSAASWVMVRDNVTGLIWEVKTDDGSVHDKDNTYTWYDSNPDTNAGDAGTPGDGTDTEDFINALNSENFGGYSDWRMPNREELQSIVDGKYNPNPAIDTDCFSDTMLSSYWSCTTHANITSYAWNINFLYGNDSSNYKSNSYYVRAVRGRQSGPFGNLVINGNGTVTDTGTGLMWQKEGSASRMNWENAITYCENLSLTGYSDWRLPAIKELASIVDLNRYNPAIDTTAFPNHVSYDYWSSTTYVSITEHAWNVNFGHGTSYSRAKSNGVFVRAVRGGQHRLLGHLVISTPNQASRWDEGALMPIEWDTQEISGNVKISISREGGKDGTFVSIADSTPNDGSYNWTVTGSASVNCVLKIEPLSDPSRETTQGLFSIEGPDFSTAAISGAPASPTNQTDATLTVGGDGFVSYRYRIDEGSYGSETPVATAISLSGFSDGSHTVYVIGCDADGIWQPEEGATTVSWIVDTVAPVITSLTDDTIPAQSKTWAWNADEPATFRYAIDQNPAWTPSGDFSDINTVVKNAIDGVWYIHVQAQDTAGNKNDVVTVSTILDNTPPTAIISDKPASLTNQTGVTLTISGYGVTHYKYRLDGGNYTSEISAGTDLELSDLDDGSHTVDVLARDSAGNWQTEPAAVTWTVDTSRPIPDISGQPNSPTNMTSATLTIGGSDITHYKYKLDTGDYSSEFPVTTQIILTGLSDGDHTVCVIGKNAAGTWQSTDLPTAVTWSVDTTPPVIFGLSDDSTPAKNKTWTWDADKNATFRYAIDQNPTCPSPAGDFIDTLTATKNAGDGAWYLHVQAKDSIGNISEVFTVSAVLDNTPPVVTASPEKELYNYQESYPALSVSLNANEATTIYYTFRSEDDPITNGYEYFGTLNITNTTILKFMAIDIAGNQSQLYSKSYCLDWTSPSTPTIDPSKNTEQTANPTPTFTWEPVFDAHHYVLQYANNQDFIDPVETGYLAETGYTLTSPLADDGRWYWRVKVTDEAGNDSNWASFNFYFADESLTHKAIIVAGGGPFEGNNLWKATKMVANKAYQALCYQGYTSETVYYISAENADHIDADATNNALQYAIKTWAQDADDLFIYMVDHGGEGTFVMREYENLLATDLDNWLDTLQQTSQIKIALVYDACRSGSFLFHLKPPEGKERILIVSTNEDEPALFADGGTVSFSWYFWTHILNGDTFYDSFIYAKNGITFSCEQYALLEAVWDGNANQKDDKDIACSTRIGNETWTAGSLPRITGISPPQILNVETSALIYADGVLDETGISRVWAVITPPGYSSGSPDNPITDLPVFELTLNESNRYEGTYHNFTEPGIYNITILAENNTGNHSLPQTTTVTVDTLLKGDINGNGPVTLSDAIIVLKVLAGMDTSGLIRTDYAASGTDVNGNNKIGMEEVVYVLQKVSGLRD